MIHAFTTPGVQQLCAGASEPLWDYTLDPGVGETPQDRAKRLHEGRRFCRLCPAAAACLRYALSTGQDGLWGGRLVTPGGVVVDLPARPKGTRRSKR